MPWVAALASVAGGMMSGKGAKKAEKKRIKLLQTQLSDSSMRQSAGTYFPGLFGSPQSQTGMGAAQMSNPGMQAPVNQGQMPQLMAQGAQPRAAGGPVNMGQPYIVGEEGPEMFQPGQSGQILPGAGGGAPAPGGAGGGYAGPPQGGGAPGGGSVYAPMGNGGPAPMGGAQAQGQQGYGGVPQDRVWTPGGLATWHTQNLLQNPGQTSTIGYERAQEQANRGLSNQMHGIMGGMGGAGVDPRGGAGQSMMQSAILNNSAQRNEAARNQTMMEEALRREDIQMGSNMYTQFLQQLFGLAGMRSGAMQSLPAPVNSMSGIGQGMSMGGYLMSQAMQNKSGTSQGAAGMGGGGAPGTGASRGA